MPETDEFPIGVPGLTGLHARYRNAATQVYNVSTGVYETWDEDNYADYQVTGITESGGGFYSVDRPAGVTAPGTVTVHSTGGGTSGTDPQEWSGTFEAAEVTTEDGTALPSTRPLPVRFRLPNGTPYDPTGNLVELTNRAETQAVIRQSTGAEVIGPDDNGGVPFQYTRTAAGDYEYVIAENGLYLEYWARWTNPSTGAVEELKLTSGPQPSGQYADTQDVYDELGEENALIWGNLSNDGTNGDSPQYIRDSLRFADVRVNVKLAAYSPPPATFPVTSTEDWVNDAINEAASKYAAGALLNKRQKQGNLVNADNRTPGDMLILSGDETLQMLIDGGLVGVTLEEEDTTAPAGTLEFGTITRTHCDVTGDENHRPLLWY